jgi:hypothetical protein
MAENEQPATWDTSEETMQRLAEALKRNAEQKPENQK